MAYFEPRRLPTLKTGIMGKKRGFMDARNENPSVSGKSIKKEKPNAVSKDLLPPIFPVFAFSKQGGQIFDL